MSTELDKQASALIDSFKWADASQDDRAKLISAFASQVREQSIAECAEKICYWCGKGNVPQEQGKIQTANGHPWWHRYGKTWIICAAADILPAPPQTTEQDG